MVRTAKDVMSRDVVCVPQDMDLRDLAKLFLEKGFTGAPVVDRDGELVGVVSQTDLLYYQLTRDDELVLPTDFYDSARIEGHRVPQKGFQIEDVNSGRVEDVMTPVVHAVAETTDVRTIARSMTTKHIHRLIVRRGNKAVGIISALDLLRGLPWDAAMRPRAVAKAAPAARKSAARAMTKAVKAKTTRKKPSTRGSRPRPK